MFNLKILKSVQTHATIIFKLQFNIKIFSAFFLNNLCKVSYTADDFSATRLVGVDPPTSDLEERTLFRGAHHLA